MTSFSSRGLFFETDVKLISESKTDVAPWPQEVPGQTDA
jgi:hypothetical protein